jgi:hypothetical protein
VREAQQDHGLEYLIEAGREEASQILERVLASINMKIHG